MAAHKENAGRDSHRSAVVTSRCFQLAFVALALLLIAALKSIEIRLPRGM
jgi:hypothetical protein